MCIFAIKKLKLINKRTNLAILTKIQETNERENTTFAQKINRPNSLKTVPSGVANYRNLPFGGRATRGSRVRLPREEGVRSRHQHLFEENIRKTEKVWSTNFKCERFGSCFYARGRY